jgi:hypothetical protein
MLPELTIQTSAKMTMKDKPSLLEALRAELDRWEELLAGMSESEITAPHLPSVWSTKDVIAHLMAWQQVSIARLEAALLDKDQEFPGWLEGTDPFEADTAENRDDFNNRIYEAYRQQSWPSVHRAWRDGFRRFLELGDAIPEDQMMDTKKYSWLRGYPLSSVLEGSYEHHHEHFMEFPPHGEGGSLPG